MGGRGGQAALRDQRAELRALQDVRHQGPEPEHRLGAARRRRRPQLHWHVILVGEVQEAAVRPPPASTGYALSASRRSARRSGAVTMASWPVAISTVFMPFAFTQSRLACSGP